MPSTAMTHCEEKRLYKVGDKKTWRWVEVAVAALDKDGKHDIRCMYCHGQVKIKKPTAAGPVGEVSHSSKVDAEHCQTANQASGARSLSSKPVE